MKTPDVIKKGLECCVFDDVENRYPNCSGCPYENHTNCENRLRSDALAYIKQLEADVRIANIQKEAMFAKAEQLEKERDAVLRDLEKSKDCESCKHKEEKDALIEYGDIPAQCCNCIEIRSQHLWRGVCEENGGDA